MAAYWVFEMAYSRAAMKASDLVDRMVDDLVD